MDVAVVGAGRVGTAIAVLLARAGHRIVAVSGREATHERAAAYLPGVPVVDPAEASEKAAVLVIGTPDDAIEATCTSMAREGGIGEGQAVVHLSGATSLKALESARSAGAVVLSIHPLQTFPSVDAALDRLPGVPMAVTALAEDGHQLGERLVLDVGGRPFRLADAAKPLYHAAAVFASNYLVAVSALAEAAGRAAGLEDPVALMAPLQRTALENVIEMGPDAALTGPAVRGDAGTIARHLEELSRAAPDAVAAYVALARAALDVGERSGRLPADRRRTVETVLERWS
jgi:predicted short-subunit dehydrogenase-like oxidoreductase (DUF2520 family)